MVRYKARKGETRYAICHPDRKYQAKDLCRRCYKIAQYHKHNNDGVPQYKQHPVKSFVVYLYYDLRTGQPVYVGEGSITRAREHKYAKNYKASTWWNKDLLLVTMTCKDEWEALEYEGKWGGYYRPTANIVGNREFITPHIKYRDKPYRHGVKS